MRDCTRIARLTGNLVTRARSGFEPGCRTPRVATGFELAVCTTICTMKSVGRIVCRKLPERFQYFRVSVLHYPFFIGLTRVE